MKDGSIVAADIQYYTNAGNSIDESTLVCKSGFSCYSEGDAMKRQRNKKMWSSILFFLQVVEKILLHMDNAYNIPNLHGRASACRTNLPSNTAFRGFGVPQSIMIVENMINDVAVLLGRPADQVHIMDIKIRETPLSVQLNPDSFLRFGRSTCTRGRQSPTTRWSSAPRTCCAAGTIVKSSPTSAPAAKLSTSSTSRTAGRRGASPSSPSNMGSHSQRAS